MAIRRIERDQVQKLVARGAQLVDVMPEQEYAESRLPNAINVPLRSLNRETASVLRHDQAVIVYCADHQ